MSDVGALVLTLGEQTTARAVESLRAQTLPIAEVVVLDGVTPFHRAFNAGAERMSSPYFLQVDADFILDPECARSLRDAMAPEIGVTVGALEDPLIGPIAGVKLFRRECVAGTRLSDTIAPEVEFGWALERRGWQTRYLVGRRGGTPTSTMGGHRPRYTLEYVFGTYYLLGARYARHNDAPALLWRARQLRRNAHRMASVARVALGHGMFADEARDVVKPVPAARDATFLRTLVPSDDPRDSVGDDMRDVGGRLTARSAVALLETFGELGASLRATSAGGLREWLRVLGAHDHPGSFVAEAALSHGAISGLPLIAPDRTMATLERLVSGAAAGLLVRA
jgi:glycosyltransferase involved in cell wall biosynthesis